MSDELIQKAYGILQDNDKGKYTIPTKGLYPFQWNWDSCLTALGFSHFDESRAWLEIESLFEHQWDDGMVPHIVFHEHDDGYFPGPDVWGTGRNIPTSGITQPAVAGHVVHQMFQRATDKVLARVKAKELLPKILKWHDWFYQCRDPYDTGLVAILHPWETGRDNSVDWDSPFEAVPTEGVLPYKRRDITHVNPEHRPTKAQYDRYIYLVNSFRALNWDNTKLHDASAFNVVDPGFNAILIRSSKDMAIVAAALEMNAEHDRFQELASRGEVALEGLWSANHQQYLCFDRIAKSLIDSPSVAGILPILASNAHARDISQRLNVLRKHCEYLVPSHDPSSALYDGLRYWRGPAWLIVNYLIVKGLDQTGETEMSSHIISDSLALIEKSGFAEYYDPITAEPCGGDSFTWTAAMVVEFLKKK